MVLLPGPAAKGLVSAVGGTLAAGPAAPGNGRRVSAVLPVAP